MRIGSSDGNGLGGMIKALISDFSRVLLFPVDPQYTGGLNALHQQLSESGDYGFWEHFQLNRALLEFYRSLGERVGVYMFTSEHIQEHQALQPELEGVFRKVLSGALIGLKKTDAESYTSIARTIGLHPSEVLYVDDNEANCGAARRAGMAATHYESNEQTMSAIKQQLH